MATATNKIRGDQAGARRVDMKLEVVVIPVSDPNARSSSTAGWVETGRHSARLWRIPIPTARTSVRAHSIRQKPHLRCTGSAQRTYLIVSTSRPLERARRSALGKRDLPLGPNGPVGGPDRTWYVRSLATSTI